MKIDGKHGGKHGGMNIVGDVNIKGKVGPREIDDGTTRMSIEGDVFIKGLLRVDGNGLVVNGRDITPSAMSSLMATPPDGTATAALKAEVDSLKEQLAAQGKKLSALEATVARLAAAK